MRSPILLSALVFLFATTAVAQRGARTIPVALDQMVQESDTIVHGVVTSAKVEPHPQLKNLMTVVVTMQVSETLKGDAAKTLQFRQYIWDIRDQVEAGRYGKGDELLLLLGPVSPYGLRSPIGLEQGRFRVGTDKGITTAVNGRGNMGLFADSQKRAQAKGIKLAGATARLAQQQATGPIALSELKTAIRTFAGAR